MRSRLFFLQTGYASGVKHPLFPLLNFFWTRMLLRQPVVTSVIIGATKMHQLKDNLKAVAVTFAPGELAQPDEVSKLPAEYAGNVMQALAGDRKRS